MREPSLRLRPWKILVVEDFEPCRTATATALERLGHFVVTCDAVGKACRLSESTAFDLIVCDLVLPDGSGLDLPRTLPDSDHTCCIAITGAIDEYDVRQSMLAGFAGHLAKPFKIDDLLSMVHEITGRPL